jgi:hypothetical protein
MTAAARRTFAVGTILVVSAAALFANGAAAAPKERLAYSIKEARAYAVKASLSKEVIELINTLRPCDPEEDPYQCDESKYNHKENCPKGLQVGRRGKAPSPRRPKGVEPTAGGSGDRSGPDAGPHAGSPVRLNRFLSLGSLSRGPGLVEAAGLASSIYVDLSGRSEPEGHTESAAASTKPTYEERCFPENEDGEVDESNHEHYLSRSFEQPSTYHLAECIGRQCNFGAGFGAEYARSIVHLFEKNGRLVGELRAEVEGLDYGEDAFKVDSLITFATFRADGTPSGLEWQVATTATGASLGGEPVTLPPGEMVSGDGFSVGVARPYVDTTKDGTELTIVAPGLQFGAEDQASYFGGAEVYAGFGSEAEFEFAGDFDDTESGTLGDVSPGGGGDTDLGGNGIDVGSLGGGKPALGEGPAPVAAGEPTSIRIFEVPTGLGVVPGLLAAGGLLWFLVLSRWLQRYSWGRRLHRMQPFKSVDWIYRAFIRT